MFHFHIAYVYSTMLVNFLLSWTCSFNNMVQNIKVDKNVLSKPVAL